MAEIGKRRSFKEREAWRTWLNSHHATAVELWLVLYKKHTGKPTVSHQEAVEEALCFGWIDGIIKSIDEERYTTRFTPRRCGSVWSETNKRRVAQMIARGRMTDFGLAKVEEAKRNGAWDKATQREQTTEVPPGLKQALRTDKQAQRNFEALSPSHQRRYALFILDAKKDETRRRRIEVAIRMLKENRRFGMDTRMTEKSDSRAKA